jgi:hypothetical protein
MRREILAYFKMLPFVLDALHELLEAFLAADVCKAWVVLTHIWAVNEAAINRILNPIEKISTSFSAALAE